ncbi:unnamed protein product [Amoebophrya sp. A25]|nr:unnamed protein product [Amoebophrya sp. A25]|eukprot:GSA25T00006921001.1
MGTHYTSILLACCHYVQVHQGSKSRSTRQYVVGMLSLRLWACYHYVHQHQVSRGRSIITSRARVVIINVIRREEEALFVLHIKQSDSDHVGVSVLVSESSVVLEVTSSNCKRGTTDWR